MTLDFPRYKVRLGAVRTRAVQRIYELDSGKSKGFLTFHQTIRKFDYNEISNILHDLAIIIPIKHEKLKLLEGVLSGIPNECLVITMSNSSGSRSTGLRSRSRLSGSLADSWTSA
jgi:mannosyl-3-phosphoglycerate synthase